MERAEVTGPNLPLKLVTSPVPEVPEGGYLIKTLHSGICHTDLHYIEDEVAMGGGKIWRHRDTLGDRFVGSVPGHEISGKIEQIGPKVPESAGLKVGDVVAVYPWRGCRDCEFCRNEYPNMCESNQSTTTDIGKGFEVGGYSSHIALPDWELALKLPDSIPSEVGCMLPCSGLTTFSAVSRTLPYLRTARDIRGKGRILIIGAGGLGLWCITLLRSVLKEPGIEILCADLSLERMQAAVEAGADEPIVWGLKDEESDLLARTMAGGKIDAAIDVVGAPKTSRIASDALHNGGTLVVLGLAGGELNLSIPRLIGRSVVVQGNRTGTVGAFRELLDLVGKAGDDVKPATVKFTLGEVNVALDKLREGKIKGRAILDFTK